MAKPVTLEESVKKPQKEESLESLRDRHQFERQELRRRQREEKATLFPEAFASKVMRTALKDNNTK